MNHNTIVTIVLSLVVATMVGTLGFLLAAGDAPQETPAAATDTQEVAIVTTIEPTPAAEEVAQEPNVLLIILDDIGLDYFPGFLEEENFTKAPMPTMEALAKDGYLFTNLTTYAMCSPTRASLLTGYHGVDTGVLDPGRTSYLDPKWQSIHNELTALTDGAITSSVIGKWHLMSRDSGISHPNNFVEHYEGIPTGNHESYFNWDKVIDGVEVGSDVYATTDLTDSALNWINEQDGQWFTWLAYTAPHDPIHLPPADLHTQDQLSGDEDDIRRNGDQYFIAMLESVDTEIGRLLDSLSAEDKANTYVIVIGDNGTGGKITQTPLKGVGGKGTLHIGGVHTPMIVYNPYQNGNGAEIDTLVSTIDFFPTVLDIFDKESTMFLPGNSFYPLINESDTDYIPSEYVFSQHLEAVMVKSDTHKLIRYTTGEEVLYDLQADMFETTDLLAANALSSTDQRAYATLTNVLNEFLLGNY